MARRVIDARLSEGRPTCAQISLDALTANLNAIRGRVEGRPVLGVVKANAYGHGALPVARCLQEAGIEYLAVALLEEAEELRRGGIACPILVMGALEPAQMDAVGRAEVTPALFREDQMEALENAGSRLGRALPFHLKVDTGMGRLGVSWTRLREILGFLDRCPHLELQGLFTHLACADDPEHPLTRIQMDRFEQAMDETRRGGRQPALVHIANSAAVLDRPPAWLNLVRPGLLLYGYHPSPRNQDLSLRPVMKVVSRIVYLKDVSSGESVGYGATFTAARPSRIATIAAGYDDGVVRSLSNRGHFLVRGKRAPIVGRISMDLTTLDVTDHPQAALGDEVVFIGDQAGAFQGADRVAEEAGTISWEILCGIGWRVPRVYLRQQRIVQIVSRFSSGSVAT
ncbi:MAG TPA: alanine racemase [Candidatus Polarisedimenticolia bacterium]|nr:alanine racemase [Candidatus Polarisedimenticolia bacterium]